MQREEIIESLKAQGCRITRQRLTLLDVILEEDCSCCKEIYYKASLKDSGIGMATVYRMVNMLEQIGAIGRRSIYPRCSGGQGEQKTDSEPGCGGVQGEQKTDSDQGCCGEQETQKTDSDQGCGGEQEMQKTDSEPGCSIELSDHTVFCLSPERLRDVMQAGLRACGYIGDQEIETILLRAVRSR